MTSIPLILSLLVVSTLCSNAVLVTQRDINRQPTLQKKAYLQLYFEAHCPACGLFITQQLKPILGIKNIWDIIDLRLVPYGHGKTEKLGNRYHFKCQHGESECQGDIIMTCALNKLERNKALEFVVCLEESSKSWNKDGEMCAQKVGADWKSLKMCTNSVEGRDWQYINGLRTKDVNPYALPTFVLNGVKTSDSVTEEIMKDLLNIACAAADEDKPAIEACNKYWQENGKS